MIYKQWKFNFTILVFYLLYLQVFIVYIYKQIFKMNKLFALLFITLWHTSLHTDTNVLEVSQ